MNGRILRALAAAGFIVGLLFLVKAWYRGQTFTIGDFYYTFPGEYAQRLNPTLWNSPDIKGALQYNHGDYFYGPTQYLLLFPIVFLDSYATAAAVLLFVYTGVLLIAWHLQSKLVMLGDVRVPAMPGVLFGVMFAFLPLTQALIQREFEVVALLM